MKERVILAVVRWLLKFVDGVHLHRDPIRKIKKEGENDKPTGSI
jgi:hypothetical protein